MSFEQGDYLVANLIIVTLIVGSYFYIRRGSRQPVRLNLKSPAEPHSSADPAASRGPPATVANVRNISRTEYRPRQTNRLTGEVNPPEAPRASGESARASTSPPPRSGMGQAANHDTHRPIEQELDGFTNTGGVQSDLNVLFNWNGHTWDAYEVLGIPAGSSPKAVRQAYETMRAKVQPDSLPFVLAALEAIVKKNQ